MSAVTQVLDPIVLRAQLLDDSGQPRRTLWLGRDRLGTAPMRITLDQTTAGMVQVTLSAVRDPGLASLLAEACPRPEARYSDPQRGGPSLGLDPWVDETDPDAIVRGYHVQHWCFPRLVIERTRRTDDPVVILGEPANIPEAFATGLAIEHPERAGWHDLWWPAEVAGTAILPPTHTYQFVREARVPPVPV